MGRRVHRVPLRDRAQDRQPGRGQLDVPPVLPVRVPHDLVRPQGRAVGLAVELADFNPVTYLFVGMRSLVDDGWAGDDLLQAAAAIVGVAVVCIGLALLALRGRVRQA